MSNTLKIQYGYKVIDFNVNYQNNFFVTIENLKYSFPFTITLDIGDVEDYCIDLPDYNDYKNLKHYLESMSPEKHLLWVQDMLENFIMCFTSDGEIVNKNVSTPLLCKQCIMRKIYDLTKKQIGLFGGEESFVSLNNIIAGFKIDVFARKNVDDDYTIWMESPGIADFDQWLELYTKIVHHESTKLLSN